MNHLLFLEGEKTILVDEVGYWMRRMQESDVSDAMRLYYQQRMIDAENRLSVTEILIAKEKEKCNMN